MKVVHINSVPYGSTGRIMFSISDMLLQQGDKSLCATGFSWHGTDGHKPYLIGSFFSKSFHMFMSRIFGNHGCYSRIATMRLIKKIKSFQPDIIHLHNIHGWYLHISTFFDFLKKSQLPVVWTLHDCWAFTGGCAHFAFVGCDKWLKSCGKCNNMKEYPIASRLDKTKKMWHTKNKLFCSLENLTIVTPSQWLGDLVKQSYLGCHPVKVINNGIDLSVFRPMTSDFKKKHNISDDSFVVLGVSMGWNKKKGLDVMIDLAKKLPRNYRMVLIGTNEKTDELLPAEVISIHCTHSQKELADIYSAADVFVNPTREDTYPTVNMEALACGTPVLTFRTGGSPEIIDDTCGSVVDCDNADSLAKEIIRICNDRPYSQERCLSKSKDFEQNKRFKEYLNLYERIIAERT